MGRTNALSYQQLQTELRRRARRGAALQRRRDRATGWAVMVEVAAPATRPLPEALHAVLMESKPVRVTDLAEAVQKAGYKTNSTSFRVRCNIALIKNSKLFKRVGAEYAAK